MAVEGLAVGEVGGAEGGVGGGVEPRDASAPEEMLRLTVKGTEEVALRAAIGGEEMGCDGRVDVPAA